MNLKIIFFFVLFLTFKIRISFSAIGLIQWWYESKSDFVFAPANWSRVSLICDGKRQSPIDINTSAAITNAGNQKLTIKNIHEVPSSINYFNTGHGYVISMRFLDENQPYIVGGPLGNITYLFNNFHFHYASEHTLNDVSFDAELHLVFFNSEYKTIANAFSQSDGLAVLGIFQNASEQFKSPRPIFNTSTKVQKPGRRFTDDKSLFSVFDVVKRKSFSVWSYLGSLTTPNCNEIVTWMVSKDVQDMGRLELKLLQEVRNYQNEKIKWNNRPTQKLNGRKIYFYP